VVEEVGEEVGAAVEAAVEAAPGWRQEAAQG
jgi:hypothetical protein